MAVQFSPVCLKRLLFFPSVQLPWYLNLKWVGHTCVALFLTLYFFSFIYISIFIPTQYCCAYYGLMLSLAINVNSSIFSKLLWLLGSMYFHVSLQLLVNFYKKILLGFWLALCWMYRSSDTKWQPSNTKFSDPWTQHLSLSAFFLISVFMYRYHSTLQNVSALRVFVPLEWHFYFKFQLFIAVYRNATDFCVSNLGSCNFAYKIVLVASSRSFIIYSLGFSTWKVLSLWAKTLSLICFRSLYL